MTTQQPRAQKTLEGLERELERIKRRVGMGWKVRVEWHPGEVRLHRGKRLKDWVQGNVIKIYVEGPKEALELVRHAFAHWLLNQSNRLHRDFSNKLIEYIEDHMYEHDERIADALARLLGNDET